MGFIAVDHIGFTVSDLDRSIEWYTRFVGAPPTLRKTWDLDYLGRIVGYPGCRMECAFFSLPGGLVLELLCYIDPRPGRVDMETFNAGNGHLCLVVADIRAEFERLRAHATFRDPAPVSIPWGPYAGGSACYLRDPDEISIELMQLPPGGPRLQDARRA
jgi:catechol 2,3-dioxygenase-like lactoylglutathione lyase family enzyme